LQDFFLKFYCMFYFMFYFTCDRSLNIRVNGFFFGGGDGLRIEHATETRSAFRRRRLLIEAAGGPVRGIDRSMSVVAMDQ